MRSSRWIITTTVLLLSLTLLAGCAAPAALPVPEASPGSAGLVTEPAATPPLCAALASDGTCTVSDGVCTASDAALCADPTGAACSCELHYGAQSATPAEQPEIFALTGSVYLDDDRTCLICDPTTLAANKTLCADPGATVSLSLGQGCFVMLESAPEDEKGGRLRVESLFTGRISLTLEAGTLTCVTLPDAAVLCVSAGPSVELFSGTACTLMPELAAPTAPTANSRAVNGLTVQLYAGKLLCMTTSPRTLEGEQAFLLTPADIVSREPDFNLLSDIALNFICTVLDGQTDDDMVELYTMAAMMRQTRAKEGVTDTPEGGVDWPANAE